MTGGLDLAACARIAQFFEPFFGAPLLEVMKSKSNQATAAIAPKTANGIIRKSSRNGYFGRLGVSLLAQTLMLMILRITRPRELHDDCRRSAFFGPSDR